MHALWLLVVSLGAGAWQQAALERVPPQWRLTDDGRSWQVTIDPKLDVADGEFGRVDPRLAHIAVVWPAPPPADGEALQRVLTRYLVITLAAHHDARAQWSEAAAWRRYNGWLRSWTHPRLHALNQDPNAYAEPAGRLSPQLNWATLVGHMLVPDPDPPRGLSLRCRLLSQDRYARARLAELGWTVEPPQCPTFARWAQEDALRSIQVGVALPSAATAGALFGHVFLRLVYDRPEDTRVVAFLANTHGPLEADGWYPVKGLFGLLETRVYDRPWIDSLRLYHVEEGRDVRLWDVRLNSETRTRLLERLWELRHSGAYAYYFFRYNCASLLLDVFNSVLAEDGQIRHFGHLGESPSAVIDALSWARSPEGGSLLVPAPSEMFSIKHAAEAADLRRQKVARALLREAPLLREPLQEAQSEHDATRASAYAKLAHLVDIQTRPAVTQYLSASATVELMRSNLANLQRETAWYRQRRYDGKQLVSEDAKRLPQDVACLGGDPWRERLTPVLAALQSNVLDTRLAAYADMAVLIKAWETDDDTKRYTDIGDRLRLWTLVVADQWFDVLTRDVPEVHRALFVRDPKVSVAQQDYVKGHRDLIDFTFSTRLKRPLLAAQEALNHVTDAQDAEPEHELHETHPVNGYERAWPHAGIDTWEATTGATGGGALTLRPTFTFGGAGFDEHLGDRTRHGFPTDTALTLLAGNTTVAMDADSKPYVLRYAGDVVRYRSVRPSWDTGSHLGWDVGVHLESDAALGMTFSGAASAGLLVPLFERRQWQHHLLLRTGGTAVAWRGKDAPLLGGGGIPVSLEGRLALGETSGITARAEVMPAYLTHLQWNARAETRGVFRLWPDCALLGVEHVGISLVAQGAAIRGLASHTANPLEIRGEAGILFE